MEVLTKTNYAGLKQKLAQGSYVLFFTAGWCPDCQFIKPAMPEIEVQYSDYQFIQVDRDENSELCQEMTILGIPSFVVFKEGKEVARFVNKDRKTKEEVARFLDGVA